MNEETNMQHLNRDNLMSLEQYAKVRPTFRAEVMAHKRDRQVAIGPHATLYFEDRLTMQYQVQEMLRIERVFEAEGIDDELSAYNPLIPDGTNWKATFMIEYGNVEERRVALAQMIGIERRVWVQVAGFERVYAIADEDLERATDDKTSSVHFLRFELTPEMVAAVKAQTVHPCTAPLASIPSAKYGAGIGMGIEHEAYMHTVKAVPENVRRSLAADLAG
jgi:hypothetical protein